MIPLAVRDCAVGELTFAPQTDGGRPCFYKGTFTVEIPADTYLDVSGWGMGEVCAAIYTTSSRNIAKGSKFPDRF